MTRALLSARLSALIWSAAMLIALWAPTTWHFWLALIGVIGVTGQVIVFVWVVTIVVLQQKG